MLRLLIRLEEQEGQSGPETAPVSYISLCLVGSIVITMNVL